MVIVATFSSGLLGLIRSKHREARSIHQQLESFSLKYNILQILSYPENCTCNFDNLPVQNEMNLTSFRTCGSGSKLIAAPGHQLTRGMVISSLKVREVQSTGTIEGVNTSTGKRDTSLDKDEYSGILTVGFDLSGLSSAVRSLEVPIRFAVESGKITKCWSKTQHTGQLNTMDHSLSVELGKLTKEITDMNERIETNEENIQENKESSGDFPGGNFKLLSDLDKKIKDNRDLANSKAPIHNHSAYASVSHPHTPCPTCPVCPISITSNGGDGGGGEGDVPDNDNIQTPDIDIGGGYHGGENGDW